MRDEYEPLEESSTRGVELLNKKFNSQLAIQAKEISDKVLLGRGSPTKGRTLVSVDEGPCKELLFYLQSLPLRGL